MADPGTVAGKKAQCDVVKKAGENPKLKTSTLVEEFSAKTEDPSFRTRTITVKSLMRQIQRAKAKATFKPAVPKSFNDLEEIPEEFKVELCDFPDCRYLTTIYGRLCSISSS
jgi:FtsZ-interacting cell division protein YlmF